MVAAHDFYPKDPTISIHITVFTGLVVNRNVIFFNLLFFMKHLKFQKMSHWNELSSIGGEWKFSRIYWQRILIEQTFLYTVVYRTFLYSPTNLKVPKKHREYSLSGFKAQYWRKWRWGTKKQDSPVRVEIRGVGIAEEIVSAVFGLT